MINSRRVISIGQVWGYRGGSGGSELVVLHSESIDGELIYHISICNLRTPDVATKYHKIEHAPISSEALLSSVTTIKRHIKSIVMPIEGYKIWKDAYKEGQAGVYKIEVSEIVELVLTQIIGIKGSDQLDK